MSAILSADDLNDFISPGVACIKPVETLPKQQPPEDLNPYEVTTEEKVASSEPPPPAQISLTDCLACSGCVTSAEAVLVSLQSHGEVLDTLDKYATFDVSRLAPEQVAVPQESRIFVASVSPQVRASLAATYNVTQRQAGNMISQLLQGPYGLRTGGSHGSAFSWVIDTDAIREICLVASADEVQRSISGAEAPNRPILTSACPGWICYAEKTHPHVLPHLSKLKSPQALTGTLVKSILAKRYGVSPQNIWHLAIMPCFDKKLEGARAELTSHAWHGQEGEAIRDVDCVITARELLMLAESRNVSFPCLPKTRVASQFAPHFPDRAVDRFLTRHKRGRFPRQETSTIGTSGGFLHHILKTQQASRAGSQIVIQPGRNADVVDYVLNDVDGRELFRTARYYGFRNIQNLVRRLKPAKASRMPGAARRPQGARKSAAQDNYYAYVEVMACPGGCTNGGGQIKVGDIATLRQVGGTGIVNGGDQEVLPAQKDWLAKVDEAYWSASDSEETSPVDSGFDSDVEMIDSADDIPAQSPDLVDGIDHAMVKAFLDYWARSTSIELDKLINTTYRAVESDVGKNTSPSGDMERVAGLAVQIGGGW